MTTTLWEVGETETDIPTMVAVADAVFVESDTDAAAIVTAGLAGTVAGAVKVAGAPLAVNAVIVPHPGEQAFPPWVRVQVTPLFPVSLVTVAVKLAVSLTGTFALGGATATMIAGTVMVAELVLVVSATDVAVIVIVRVLGGGAGGAV